MWTAAVLAALAWCLFLTAFLFDNNRRFALVLLAGLPGLGSQAVGLLGARRAQRIGGVGPVADLPWIAGVVPSLPLVFIAVLTVIPVPFGL